MARRGMNSGPLWQVSLRVNREAEEAVVELMESVFGQAPSAFAPEESSKTVVSVYSRRASVLSERKSRLIRRGLEQLKQIGVIPGPCRLSVRQLEAQDWAESWKRHFKPLQIGRRLLVQPSWSRRRPRPNQALVVLDPGLSFGTGQHPTTEYCLRQLVACRPDGKPVSFLDLGTGSGILAIAAVKLGYRPVLAIDNDPAAVQAARANADANSVLGKLRIQKRDITRFSSDRSFDLVCANLTADLLQAAAPSLRRLMKPGGNLVLAGILDTQFPALRRSYERAGLELVSSQRKREWRSGRFEAAG